MPAIILTNEGMEHTVFPLGRALLLIGRDSESGLLLDSDQISSNHASIIYHEDHYVVRDNGSASGTYVNGTKTDYCTLSHNDLVSFGPYQFRVDLKGNQSGATVPNQEPTHITQRGQEYRHTVNLKPVQGLEASGSVRVMMAGKTQPLRPKAAAAKVPVPTVVAVPRKNSYLRWGFATLAIAAAVTFIVSVWEGSTIKELEEQKEIISALSKPKDSAEARIQELEKNATRNQEALRRAIADLKKSNEELSAVKNQAAGTQEALRRATDDLKKSYEELSALKKKFLVQDPPKKDVPPKAPIPKEILPTDAPKREAIALKLGPIKDLPALEFPPKVSTIKATEVPIVLNEMVVGSRKIPEGQTFPVLGMEQDVVLLDIGGESVRLPKKLTDFQPALEAANLSLKNENERAHKERDLLIDKMLKEEKIAEEASEREKAELAKLKVNLSLRVQEILKVGLLGTSPTGVKIFLTGADCSATLVGETWNGEAYPMGVFQKPYSDLKFRHYTADIKELSAFRKSGSSEEAVSREANEAVSKEQKDLEEQLTELMNLIDPTQTIKELKSINESRYLRPQNEQFAHVNADKLLKTEGPKLKKAAAKALELLKRSTLNSQTKAFLEHVIVASDMCDELRLPDFSDQLRRIDVEALNLKASFLINSQTGEKKN